MQVISVKKENLKKMGYEKLTDWLQNPNHIYIGRNMSFYVEGAIQSKWANPYCAKKYGLEKCLELYEAYIKNNKILMNSLKELKGKTLGCWCRNIDNIDKKIICHGDILVKLVKEMK